MHGFKMLDVLHLSDIGEKFKYNVTVYQLFVDLKKACDSVRREVLYSIFTEFDAPIKIGRLIETF
jgi:hypothetical protein